jgi:hypothetical protein
LAFRKGEPLQQPVEDMREGFEKWTAIGLAFTSPVERCSRTKLLVAVPNVSGELPIASDLLPYHHVFASHLLRLLPLSHQREHPDLTGRIGTERLHIHRGQLYVANVQNA